MERVEGLLRDLVRINSVNPDLVPGAAGEAAIADFVSQWLRGAGLEVHVHEVLPGRPNVVGIARGKGGGRTLLLNGHMDTVGVEGMQQPFEPRLEAGRLFGRGAYDMKGGLAACMIAAAEAMALHLAGDVIVAAVMDEEYAGLGTMDLAKRYHADSAIVAEPTELQLVVAHKGFVWLEVETQGVAAHGSRPHLGVDAIAKMGAFLVELEHLGLRLQSLPGHPLLGAPSVHASLITGGQEMSSYPERCVLSVERRTLPGETPEAVEAEMQGIVTALQRRDVHFRATVRRGLARSPLETPVDADITGIVRRAAEPVLSRACPPVGISFWTDAATLGEAGLPTVLFGPVGAGAHAAEEWVDLQSVRLCAEVLRSTVIAFCS